ncbi:MAG: hypothetical protein U0325_05260 [Polyangiales bacterium]
MRLQRAGYAPFTRRVTVTTAGARVDASLAWADPIAPAEGARISLRCNVSLASVSLDGHPVRADGGQLVPPGGHTLRVERAGYVPVERAVTLRVGDNEVVQWLDATPALQAQHDARVRSARAPAVALLTVGGAVLLGGAPLLVTGVLDNQRAAEDYAAVERRQTTCSQRPGDPSCTGPNATTQAFNAQLLAAQSRVDEGFLRAAIGGAMVGVGAAAMVVGAVLFARSGTLGGFDRPAGWALRVSPSGAALDVSF